MYKFKNYYLDRMYSKEQKKITGNLKEIKTTIKIIKIIKISRGFATPLIIIFSPLPPFRRGIAKIFNFIGKYTEIPMKKTKC